VPTPVDEDAQAAAADVLAVGPVRIDRAALTVEVDGQRVELTPTEYKLLVTLAERRGRVQARSHLLETVWEAAPDIQTRTVDMHVQRLRAKLGVAGELIETVRGFGYRLRAGITPAPTPATSHPAAPAPGGPAGSAAPAR
jgi:two-component system phosphate regulon response regulator PhoB